MRPASLDDMVGQRRLLAPGSALRRAVESGRVHSMILWGPPGCGKTTLALLLARYAEAEFVAISAVLSGLPQVRKVLAAAEARFNEGRRTVLFVDEVHRFNKTQQDAFLPHIERGSILVGGATTGGTAQLHQQLVLRPTPGGGRSETPVPGLYLASASAHPGGGVHGACGSNAARAAVWHDRIRRTRRWR